MASLWLLITVLPTFDCVTAHEETKKKTMNNNAPWSMNKLRGRMVTPSAVDCVDALPVIT
jgi:hypothetical protein